MIYIYLEMIYHYYMEEQRICTACKIIKNFSEFHWYKKWDIPFSRCKECYNAKCKQYRKSKQGKDNYREWIKGNGKIVRHKAISKWRKNNPGNRSAHTAVSNAIRDGRLLRQSCAICQNPVTEGHHTSYAPENWLNVIWLCKKHHTEETYKSCIS